MEELKYSLNGEIYDEKIKIKYDDILIYYGYVDDLVTSISGELELQLNFGNYNNISSVICKKLNSSILCIPKISECFRDQYYYCPMIFSIEIFKDLWSSIRYNYNSDLQLIRQINLSDIILMWLVSSKCRNNGNNIHEYLKYIFSKLICMSKEKEFLNIFINDIFKNSFELLEIEYKIINVHNKMETVFFYLDKKLDYKWEALKVDEKQNIYLYLGNNKCIHIFRKSNNCLNL